MRRVSLRVHETTCQRRRQTASLRCNRAGLPSRDAAPSRGGSTGSEACAALDKKCGAQTMLGAAVTAATSPAFPR